MTSAVRMAPAVFVISAIKVMIVASSTSLSLIFSSFAAVKAAAIHCFAILYLLIMLSLAKILKTILDTKRARLHQPLLLIYSFKKASKKLSKKLQKNRVLSFYYAQTHVLHYGQQPCDEPHLGHQQNVRCADLHTWQKAVTIVRYPWHHEVAWIDR